MKAFELYAKLQELVSYGDGEVYIRTSQTEYFPVESLQVFEGDYYVNGFSTTMPIWKCRGLLLGGVTGVDYEGPYELKSGSELEIKAYYLSVPIWKRDATSMHVVNPAGVSFQYVDTKWVKI